MKNLRRILSVLLTIAVLVGTLVIPAAAGNDEQEEIVARMYIGHKERYMNLSGHTWIYIENLTDHELTVGAYQLKSGRGVSVGTFGFSIVDGKGLYYNAEAYRYQNVDMSEAIFLSKELTQEQLDKVSKKILNSGTWDYTLNCAYFAIKVWNAAFGQPLIYMMIPTLHQLQILIYPGHFKGISMTVPKLDDVYKQIGRGKRAFLVNADPRVPD